MADQADKIALFPGEEIIECNVLPEEEPAPAIGTDLLVELVSNGRRQMPVASRVLDLAAGQGRFEAEFARDALVMAGFVSTILPELTVKTDVAWQRCKA
jgi:hypothetical protein